MNIFSISDCITNCAYARLLRVLAIISLLLVCSDNPIAPMSYGDPGERCGVPNIENKKEKEK
mgnify:CR=1